MPMPRRLGATRPIGQPGVRTTRGLVRTYAEFVSKQLQKRQLNKLRAHRWGGGGHARREIADNSPPRVLFRVRNSAGSSHAPRLGLVPRPKRSILFSFAQLLHANIENSYNRRSFGILLGA